MTEIKPGQLWSFGDSLDCMTLYLVLSVERHEYRDSTIHACAVDVRTGKQCRLINVYSSWFTSCVLLEENP